tara:strand:- start:70 stop:843 length:774 start_codon:yes stop_codon:yes gene_type:complete
MRLLVSTLVALVFGTPVLAAEQTATTVTMSFWEANGFWAGILGAAVGGLIAFAIQLKVLRENRELRNEDRKLSQQAMANSLVFKLRKIYSNFSIMQEHVDQCFSSDLAKEEGAEIWQFLLPLGNPPPSIELSSDEMSMLLSLGDLDVFNAVAGLDDGHNALMDSVRLYTQKREELTSQLQHVGRNDSAVVSVADEKEKLTLLPYFLVANSVASALAEHTDRGFSDSNAALTDALKLLKDKELINFNMEFTATPSGHE